MRVRGDFFRLAMIPFAFAASMTFGANRVAAQGATSQFATENYVEWLLRQKVRSEQAGPLTIDPALKFQQNAAKSLDLIRKEHERGDARLKNIEDANLYTGIAVGAFATVATMGTSVLAQYIGFGAGTGTSGFASIAGGKAVAAVESFNQRQMLETVSALVAADQRSYIVAAENLPPEQQAQQLLQGIRNSSAIAGIVNDPDIGAFARQYVDRLTTQLNGKKSGEVAARTIEAVKRAPQRTSAERLQNLKQRKQATEKLKEVIAIRIDVVMTEAGKQSAAAASGKDVELQQLASDLKKGGEFTKDVRAAVGALRALGLDGETAGALEKGLTAADSAMQLLGGVAQLYAFSPTGILPTLQGLAGLFGQQGDGQQNAMAGALRAIEVRLERIEKRLENIERNQRYLAETVSQLQIETSFGFRALEAQIEKARREIVASTGDIAFQNLRTCNALQDYLARDGARDVLSKGVSASDAQDFVFTSVADRARIVLTDHTDAIVMPCLEALRSLFASERSLSLSNPLLRQDRVLGVSEQRSLERRQKLASIISGELQGYPVRYASNDQIREYLFRGMFMDNPALLAITWVDAVRGRLKQSDASEFIQLSSLASDDRVNSKRVVAISEIVQSVLPIYWLVDEKLNYSERFDPNAAQVRKATDIASNVRRPVAQAILDESLSTSVLGAPFLLQRYSGLVDVFAETSRKLTDVRTAAEEARKPNHLDAERSRIERERVGLENTLERTRREIFVIEAVLASNPELVQQVTAFELVRAALRRGKEMPTTSAGLSPALVDLKLAETLLPSDDDPIDKTMFRDRKTGKRRDIYREMLSGSVFSWQFSEAADGSVDVSSNVAAIYDPRFCYQTVANERRMANWIAETSLSEPLTSYCARLEMREAEERSRKDAKRMRPLAFFAGGNVRLPSTVTLNAWKTTDDLRLLRQQFESLGLLLRATSSTVTLDAKGDVVWVQ